MVGRPTEYRTPQTHVCVYFSGGSSFGNDDVYLREEWRKWGIGNYYINMPWSWARFIVEGMRIVKEEGSPLKLDYVTF